MSEDKAVTIASLEVENVTKIKAVAIKPERAGLTVIGGRNAQGKTSVLDAICWALGGKKYEPDRPRRDGSVSDPHLRVELSNGIVAERSGKNGTLRVTDPSGARAGQALLDGFVESFALDLPRFMAASDRDKALALLRAVGVEDELRAIDAREAALAEQRRVTGQVARQYAAAADAMPYHYDAPDEPVDISEIMAAQREAYEHNACNERVRREAQMALDKAASAEADVSRLRAELESAEVALAEARERRDALAEQAAGLADIDTGPMAEQAQRAEEVNAKVRANRAKDDAKADAEKRQGEYDRLTEQIEQVRRGRVELLEGADMPLEGLSVEGGALTYQGDSWGSMSASMQLMVATAIVRKINPACGFVLVDKLEQMDAGTLAEFAEWCEAEGLQVIGTRVSTGDECTVVIEDGTVADKAFEPAF